MAKPPAPTALVDEVRRAIVFMSPNPPAGAPNDDDKLESKWRLFTYQRRALAGPFERAARGYKDDAVIARGKCEELKTVKAAIKLVATAAGFSYDE